MDACEAAWFAVHDVAARLPGWTVARAELHDEEGRWHVTAVDAANRDRRAMHEAIEATGATDVGPFSHRGVCRWARAGA